MSEDKANRQIQSQSYMNRMFCSTKERVSYIMYKAFGQTTLGKYDVGSELWLYKMYGIKPTAFAKAQVALGIYDIINDPVSAAIIDNMRTRWGKFKPFQYLSLLPAIIMGIFICMLPVLANQLGLDAGKRLSYYMVYLFVNETVNAFFGGGGYIDNVFTPNPNERTSLLVSSKFVGDLLRKFPEQLVSIILDIAGNSLSEKAFSKVMTKTFVTGKWVVWIISMVPTIFWYINSKERVAQSEKPPNPIKGFLSVFKNKPLLIYTLSDLIDGIDIGQGGDLYYNDVLHFNTLTTIAGIPGSPISYASYGFVSKFREKFSTKTLWFFCRGSSFIADVMFLGVGLIGGKKKGLYLRKIPMACTFAVGNCISMCFYATKRVIGDEINYEVLDYCEWQNGYRVEATVNMMKGYFTKVKDIILKVVNAWLLETWAGFKVGEGQVQTLDTKFRLFVTAFGPKLIFDAFCFIPMFFYNIDANMRKKMYSDLERMRSMRAAMAEIQNGENTDTPEAQ